MADSNVNPNVEKYVTLLNGVKMPIFGLGTLSANEGEVEKAVEDAIRAGYRMIDTAWAYKNEKEIGNALHKLFDEGFVTREEVFITTKCAAYFHTRQEVHDSLMESLRELRLDYVDMFLVHTPVAFQKVDGWREMLFPVVDGKMMLADSDHLDTWAGMEDCYNKGKAKAIGLSNFSRKQIQRIWDHCNVKPMNLQVECHAYFKQKALHDFCREKGIPITAYSPIGAPGSAAVQQVMKGGKSKSGKALPPLLEHGIVKSLASRYKKTPAQILLRYLVQRGIIVIPKSTNPIRIEQNFEIWDFSLSDGDFDELSILPEIRLNDVASMSPELAQHPNYDMD